MKKRSFAIGALLLVFVVFAALAVPAAEEKKLSKKAGKLMAKAMEAIKEKQPDKAIALLRQVVFLEPENAMVRHNLGVLYSEKGLADEAIASFEEALHLQNDYRNALLALRQALFETATKVNEKKEYEKANAYLLKLVSLPRPDSEDKNMLAWAQYLLGYNFFNLKQYDKASEFFGKCQVNEGLEKSNLDLFANATYYLGMMNNIQSQYALSNEYFQKYLALYAGGEAKPKWFSHANYFIGANLSLLLKARLDKGDVAKMNESAREILPYLKIAVEMNISSEDAYVLLGNCYVFLEDYDNAIQTYQKLIELFPQSSQLKNYQFYLQGLQKTQKQAEKPKKKR